MTIKDFLDIFRSALEEVSPLYYGHLKWHIDRLHAHLEVDKDFSEITWTKEKVEEFEEFLRRYDERVFCYELYHQIRSTLDQMEKAKPRSTYPFCLQAELKKTFIPELVANHLGAQKLEAEYFPDLLLHSPGDMHYNGIIIEVKALPNIPFSKIDDDLQKIQEFITKYKYEMGLLLIINNPAYRIQNIIDKFETKEWIRNNLPDSSRILLLSKENTDAKLLEYCLGDLIKI